MSARGPLAVGVLVILTFCLYQRVQINRLTHELTAAASSCAAASVALRRPKRSITISPDEDSDDDNEIGDGKSGKKNSIYFPVYAQISRKAMRKLCDEHRMKGRGKEEKRLRETRRKVSRNSSNQLAEASSNRRPERKKCSTEVDFSPPKLIARRGHNTGCALRDGRKWLVCEFHMGYTMLEFADAPSLTASLPRALRTLPYPYHGTDAAALDSSVAYSTDDNVVLFNLTTGVTMRLSIASEKEPLYNSSSHSRMDVQADEHGLWILYREPGQDTLTVSRASVPGMKLLSTWPVNSIRPRDLCNAFVRCGILYTITCGDGEALVRPVYDFYSAIDIVGRETELPGVTTVDSAQYDATSHSVTIFSQGSIISLSVNESTQRRY